MAQDRAPDQVDLDIVRALQDDPLSTNKAIAAQVGVAETTVALRIRALAENNMMRVVVQRDFSTVRYNLISLIYARVLGRPVPEVVEELCALPQTNSVSSAIGTADIFIVAGAADHAELRDVVDNHFAKIEGLTLTEEQICLDILRYHSEFGDLQASHVVPEGRSQLEPLDEEILAPLMFDARVSNREVARRLGISEGAVRMHLKRLTEAKLIRLGAVRAPAAFDMGSVAVIRVHVQPGQINDLVERTGNLFSFMARVTGRYNLVLLANLSSDIALLDLCDTQLRSHPGVLAIEVLKLVTNGKHNYNLARIG